MQYIGKANIVVAESIKTMNYPEAIAVHIIRTLGDTAVKVSYEK